MRAAPPVSVRCTGGLAWSGLTVAAPAVAAAVVVLWAAGHAGFTPWLAVPAVSVVAALAAWRLPAKAPHGVQMSWDGQTWRVDGLDGAMAVMIDLGPWLLLRLKPATQQRPVWIPVAAVEPRAAVHALRAALYCRSSMAAAPGAPSSPHPQSE